MIMKSLNSERYRVSFNEPFFDVEKRIGIGIWKFKFYFWVSVYSYFWTRKRAEKTLKSLLKKSLLKKS